MTTGISSHPNNVYFQGKDFYDVSLPLLTKKKRTKNRTNPSNKRLHDYLQSEVQRGYETYPKITELIAGDLDTNPYPPSHCVVVALHMMSDDSKAEEGVAQEALSGARKA